MMEKRRKKAADSSRKKARPQKQKTTIIFQGGGSRGAHQAGAMKYLDEIGVKPDIIIGSSIGVINACLYATGGVEGMIKFWTSFKANPISSGISLRENIFLGNSFLSMRRGFEYIEGFFDFEKIFRNQTEICFALTNGCPGSRSTMLVAALVCTPRLSSVSRFTSAGSAERASGPTNPMLAATTVRRSGSSLSSNSTSVGRSLRG